MSQASGMRDRPTTTIRNVESGIYEQLITRRVAGGLAHLPPEVVKRVSLDPVDAPDVLAEHVRRLVRHALHGIGDRNDDARLGAMVDLTNQLLDNLASLAPHTALENEDIDDSHDVLFAIADSTTSPAGPRFPQRPETPLSASALLVNGHGQPRLGTEVQRELASSDRVDLLCAFIKWHGVRIIDEHLKDFLQRGGRLRVITTTYMGASEQRAIDRLAELGAEIRISYETRTTRLHAKAWLFHRKSGYTTAYVGSSNLSKSALLDGLEWNVRLSAQRQEHLIETFRATFDEYWEDPGFEPYRHDDEQQRIRLHEALETESHGPADLPIDIAALDVRPWGYQAEILEQLHAERVIHDRPHSLVVMATGTGKTVVAALDYRRLREAGTVNSLLFVAHRDEILAQSQRTFCHVLRDASFGERLVGGDRPTQWRHVFASVQSLARMDLARELDSQHFDMVIVDEFHHAEAATYTRLLEHLSPKVLVGLTATPERADGLDIRRWFGGRIAVELRLWEALERGLLAPFQYFGIHDGTDLGSTTWRRSGYDIQQLENLYTGDDARARIVIRALAEKVADIHRMRALGFCVSIRHAEFMADRFNKANIPARAVTSLTPAHERRAAIDQLRRRELKVLFTVDLFNEGVDIPEVDTILLLRPTESATVFLQQLGRGLRLADDKACLTVLDFIGVQHDQFRFDLRFRAVNGVNRRLIAHEVEQGFPTLPPGCHVQLDRKAAEIVLANVRQALRVNWKSLVNELRSLGDISLSEFLEATGLSVDDVYRRARGGWTGLRRQAGFAVADDSPEDQTLAKAFGRLLHVDDEERLAFLSALAREPQHCGNDPRSQRLLLMAHFALWGAASPAADLQGCLANLTDRSDRCDELSQLMELLDNARQRVTSPLDPLASVPLHVHARYSRDEALAAFGVDNPSSVRQGVKWVEAEQADLFFVTLRKTEKHYSPATMYQDRAISPHIFQWESQHTMSQDSPTGQRYQKHRELGTTVHLFVRESKEADGDLGAPPYTYLGPANYMSHTGDRPMKILWHLQQAMPADVFYVAKTAAG